MKYSAPVVKILFAERRVESVRVSRGRDVGRRSAFAEHLLNRISRDKMDEQEDEAHYQPDDRESVEHALEEGFRHRSSVAGR